MKKSYLYFALVILFATINLGCIDTPEAPIRRTEEQTPCKCPTIASGWQCDMVRCWEVPSTNADKLGKMTDDQIQEAAKQFSDCMAFSKDNTIIPSDLPQANLEKLRDTWETCSSIMDLYVADTTNYKKDLSKDEFENGTVVEKKIMIATTYAKFLAEIIFSKEPISARAFGYFEGEVQDTESLVLMARHDLVNELTGLLAELKIPATEIDKRLADNGALKKVKENGVQEIYAEWKAIPVDTDAGKVLKTKFNKEICGLIETDTTSPQPLGFVNLTPDQRAELVCDQKQAENQPPVPPQPSTTPKVESK